jgi:type IV pilus assembly protein PilQ
MFSVMIIWGLSLLMSPLCAYSQTQESTVILDSLSKSEIPKLNTKISLSISHMQVDDLLRAVANEAELNVSIPERIGNLSSINFTEVKSKDILSYLCKENNLLLEVVGNIIKIYPRPLPVQKEREIIVEYNKLNNTIVLDLMSDPLQKVVKLISKKSGVNIIISPEVSRMNVSGFYKDVSIEKSLELLALSNNINVEKESDELFIIEKKLVSARSKKIKNVDDRDFGFIFSSNRDIIIDKETGISISVKDVLLSNLFEFVANEAGLKYRMYGALDGRISVNVKNVKMEAFLYNLFKGTKYSYRLQNGICYTGAKNLPYIKDCQLIQLNNRSVLDLTKKLPTASLKNLEIKEFEELNSLFVCGYSEDIFEFKSLLKYVDKKVPVVLIDVMIIDVKNSSDLSFGMTAGIGDQSATSSGKIYPSVDVTLSSSSINRTLNNIGLSSLGRLSPNIYVKLKALEEAGKIDIKSTPRLSTLNGNEAKLKIGQKEYYKETRNSYWGTQDPQLSAQINYKPVEANLEIRIKPIVTGDGSVNMKIFVEQSDFTKRMDANAPPGLITRQFESMIRVMDRETILLGGLEVSSKETGSSGLPFIARIPVLRWIFGYRTKKKSKTRLNVIIKPTIL